MKCIVYPSPAGVWITTPAPRTAEMLAAFETRDALFRELAGVSAAARAKHPAKFQADVDDIKALEARQDALTEQILAATPTDDDDHIAAIASALYPDGGFLIVDKDDLPTTGDSATDWVIRDGKVELR